MTIEDLPDNVLLNHIVVYLSTAERCRLFGLSRRLFFTVKDDCEKSIRKLTIAGEDHAIIHKVSRTKFWPKRMLKQNFSQSLQTLDLGSHCNDKFLVFMTDHRLFPSLRNISMVGSLEVSDQGLEYLSKHASNVIESIDLTFCNNTTYAGTFCLRDRFRDSLRLLRRLPVWLDGHVHTPFNGNNNSAAAPEVHTYYPDGTFSFSRRVQSRGFVSRVTEWDDGAGNGRKCVVSKIQYSNFEPHAGWPTFAKYSYRPSVCLFTVPDEQEEDGTLIQSVLVGQEVRSLQPSLAILDIVNNTQSLSHMAFESSTYFAEQDSGSYAQSETLPIDERGRCVMISRMRVHPLESDLPPESLVEECRTTCKKMNEIGTTVIDRFEAFLNMH